VNASTEAIMTKQVTLVLKQTPSLPVEAESINPEAVAGKGVEEIKRLPLWCGNCQESVGAYFDVEVTEGVNPSAADGEELPELFLKGDLSRFQRLGQGVRAGLMVIQGAAGFHAGAAMRGGRLVIQGDAGDWLGAEMEGGLIQVEGSTGHFAGAAYRGETKGMTGGTILVRGNAGQRLGARMRRGLIAVGGDCGDTPGYGMLAGSVLICGQAGIRVASGMVRGTVILLQGTPSRAVFARDGAEAQALLPTFYYNCTYQPLFWKLLCVQLAQAGFPLPAGSPGVSFRRYSGDANEGCRGEVLIADAKT
jgi:formylmethanofuran dehydrogenase subunit C